MLTLGVLADTHIPDRSRRLHPEILPIFSNAGVHAILHAGDICLPKVLTQLDEVAPVHAVRGNRDWFGLTELPTTCVLHFEDVTIGMTHGHASLSQYLRDKFRYLLQGPGLFKVITERAIHTVPPDINVVVFGHNHHPENYMEHGKLIFNPGSASRPIPKVLPPSIGLLYIDGNNVKGEIVQMEKIKRL
jgi:putative phosphoesterase